MADTIQELYEKYRTFVCTNTDTASNLESGLRIISYLIAGRFEDSTVISELVYSLSNLLVLFNDNILRKAHSLTSTLSITETTLRSWLAVIEYVEVFLEMAARRIWGEFGQWIIIVSVQLIKALLRFLLLKKYGTGIQCAPSVLPLDRGGDLPNTDQQRASEMVRDSDPPNDPTFTLSSGRQIRTLAASPPIEYRKWSVPEPTLKKKRQHRRNYEATVLNKRQTIAEVLHITRPLLHLCSLYSFGQESWKPWILSCGIDVSSLLLMGNNKNMNPAEKAEMNRRTVLLLYYMLRSPFYDRHAKMKLFMLLQMVANNVPLTGMIIRPLIHYLPFWQRIYAYVWTT